MKAEFLEEPMLIFGEGKSICPRDGIANLKVYDTVEAARRDQLLIGIVGIEENVEEMRGVLKTFEAFIPASELGKQPGLFKEFPGFMRGKGYCAKMLYDSNYERIITPNEINEIKNGEGRNEQVTRAVDTYAKHVDFLSNIKNCDVILCIVPKELEKHIVAEEEVVEVEETAEDKEGPEMELNFRRALKARVMRSNKPIQLVKEESMKDKKSNQDTATKAWNLCTALYYKALQTIPWKLDMDENRPRACFVGIGFYRSRDRSTIQTSLAQIFNENGKGVILRGNTVKEDKEDRIPHLEYDQAFSLLKDALEKYKFATGSLPGRIVLHKTSKYYQDELDGFEDALSELHITEYDVVTLLETDLRFFRDSTYPPARGSLFQLTKDRYILYTRGAVHQYQTYPGMYIPAPLDIRIVKRSSSPKNICREILGLTKMNWNSTQFDHKYPITIACARKVGEIMKYLGPNEVPKEAYAFYM